MSRYKIISFFLVLCMVFSFSAYADITDDSVNRTINGDIASEYYTEDIFEEPDVKSVAATLSGGVPDVNAKSLILMEISTGKILTEKNSHEKLSPASITKIMTLLLVTEAIDSGKISLNDKVETSEHAASMGGSQIWLKPGEVMTVHELLKAATIASANDASVALAEFISGSEEAFVSMMNERAKQLGMKDTTFKNACGLDEDGHITSANDVALMSRALLQHDTIKKYSTVWMDSLRNGQTQLVNTNKLVRYYSGCTGLKTGTTSKAGFCVSASAKRGNMELVAVIMGGAGNDDRFVGARQMLDYGFANWTIGKPEIAKDSLHNIKVVKGVKDSVPVETEELANLLLKKGEEKKLKTEISLAPELTAPVIPGQEVGKIIVKLDGKQIGETKVYAAEAVDKVTFLFSLSQIVNELFKL